MIRDLREVIEDALRRCRVEDAPIRLIKEPDVYHVASMVLRAVLDATADEPTALAGYMVAPDAHGDLAIWRGDELFPTVAITQQQIDPALWDVLVAAVERGQA